MNILNFKARKVLVMLLLYVVSCADGIAQQAPSEDVSAKVQTLWVQNSINDLKTYLSTVKTTYPNYVPALIASAFYDYIFTGNMNQALQTLQAIQSDVQSNPSAYSATFKAELGNVIREVNDEIRIQTNAGRDQTQWQINANPQAVRSEWSTDYHPIIDLGTSSPKIYLGQH